jgi:chromosome partitioning protein
VDDHTQGAPPSWAGRERTDETPDAGASGVDDGSMVLEARPGAEPPAREDAAEEHSQIGPQGRGEGDRGSRADADVPGAISGPASEGEASPEPRSEPGEAKVAAGEVEPTPLAAYRESPSGGTSAARGRSETVGTGDEGAHAAPPPPRAPHDAVSTSAADAEPLSVAADDVAADDAPASARAGIPAFSSWYDVLPSVPASTSAEREGEFHVEHEGGNRDGAPPVQEDGEPPQRRSSLSLGENSPHAPAEDQTRARADVDAAAEGTGRAGSLQPRGTPAEFHVEPRQEFAGPGPSTDSAHEGPRPEEPGAPALPSAQQREGAEVFHVEHAAGQDGEGTAPGWAPEEGHAPARAPAATHDEPEDELVIETTPPPAPAPPPLRRPRFDRARILAVANQKGGVGKTTTAVSLAAAVAETGAQVLLVDLDPQGNASSGLGMRPSEGQATIYHVLIEDLDVLDAVVPASMRNLYVVPTNIDLAGAEIELVSMFSREQRLRKALHSVVDEFDLIIIDCPPSLGLLTVNALTAADGVIVPIQCEYYALEGLGALSRNADLVKANLNPDLEITGFVLTMLDARTRLSQQVVEEVRRHFGDRVFKTWIPRTVRLAEAPSFGEPITVFDPGSRGAMAYRRLAGELLARLAPHART